MLRIGKKGQLRKVINLQIVKEPIGLELERRGWKEQKPRRVNLFIFYIFLFYIYILYLIIANRNSKPRKLRFLKLENSRNKDFENGYQFGLWKTSETRILALKSVAHDNLDWKNRKSKKNLKIVKVWYYCTNK